VARQTDDHEAARPFEDAVARLGAAARLLATNGRVPHVGDDDAGALMPITGREPDDCAPAWPSPPRSSDA
jgi:hypothetical protein